MTAYQSDIVLGEQYRHRKLGIVGYAEAVIFYANACERVDLLYLHSGEAKSIAADAVDLIAVETEEPVKTKKPGGPERSTPRRTAVGRVG